MGGARGVRGEGGGGPLPSADSLLAAGNKLHCSGGRLYRPAVQHTKIFGFLTPIANSIFWTGIYVAFQIEQELFFIFSIDISFCNELIRVCFGTIFKN